MQGIYPTLMLVVLRESIWNVSDESADGLAVSTVRFMSAPLSGSGGSASRTLGKSLASSHVVRIDGTTGRVSDEGNDSEKLQ